MSTGKASADPAAPAVELLGLVKRYGQIAAVDGLDLVVPTGICFGLLGPNGAGKSTTMRMLTAQTIADAGELEKLRRAYGTGRQEHFAAGGRGLA